VRDAYDLYHSFHRCLVCVDSCDLLPTTAVCKTPYTWKGFIAILRCGLKLLRVFERCDIALSADVQWMKDVSGKVYLCSALIWEKG
jgi:hypothetical protein